MAAADAANDARLAAAAKAKADAAKVLTQKEIDAITAQQVADGIKSTDRAARLPGETASEANARITQGYKDQPKPELTVEGKAAGATVEFVRTAAGGVGTYKEVFPVGTPIPEKRVTESGNVYDAEGTLISGTGLKTATQATGVTPTQVVPSNPTVAAGGSPAGRDTVGKEIFYKTEGGTNVGFYYADGSKVPVENLVGVKQTLDFANAGWSIQGLPKGQTPGDIKYAAIITAEQQKGPKPGGNAYFNGEVVIVNDGNGVSIYGQDGKLLSGKGSQYQIGMGTVNGVKINIAGVGTYGSPEYNPNATSATATNTTAVPGVPGVSPTGAKNITIPPGVTVTTTYVDPKTGDTVGVLSNGTTQILSAGDTLQTNRVSTMNTLIDRFNKYGLSSLANKIKELAIDGATESTITLQLQETPEYQQRFSANAARIKQGLQVLNPAEYLSLEDGYRQVLRAYGLKAFDTDAYVQQFIANDVSAAELSNRVVTAVQRVQNADPAVQQQLRDYYGIGQQDLVAYVLDPQQQFQKIERQVAASEIGVAAGRQGLKPGVAVAEQLAAQGVTQAEAQKGYATIADILPTAEKLSSIYGKTMDTYGQSEAEQEVFNSLASAQRKREKLTARELASFSGAAGTNKTSLTTSSVGQF